MKRKTKLTEQADLTTMEMLFLKTIHQVYKAFLLLVKTILVLSNKLANIDIMTKNVCRGDSHESIPQSMSFRLVCIHLLHLKDCAGFSYILRVCPSQMKRLYLIYYLFSGVVKL